MKKPQKLLSVPFALALLTAASHAELHSFGSGANQFDIDFIDIDYAGNSADSATGYGSVGYNYRIGTFEVTIDQFTKADAESGSTIGNGNENIWNSGVTMPSPYGDANFGVDAPAGLVSWVEAAKFVNWLSSGDVNTGVYSFSGSALTGINRSYRNGNDLAYVLPTENEWYKAAYYKPVNDGSYSLYSSGLDSEPSTNGWNYNPAHEFKPAWETGSGGQEQNGTYDMMGNVWEWTESLSAENLRGGSAYAPANYLSSTNGYYIADATEQANYGFRVVAIPEPSSVAIMLMVGTGVLGVRRIFSI